MGMIVCSGVTAQAQTVFQQDFSQPNTEDKTAQGWYEFINLQPNDGEEKADVWTIENEALVMNNSSDYACEGQKWQRGIKFRNLAIKEKTLYKLSFKINPEETPTDMETFEAAPGYVDYKLMQGDENADICIIDAAGAEQRDNKELTAGTPQTISKLFYFADLAAQNEKYETNCAGKENYAPGKFFVSVNVYSPGKYILDDFVLEEASPLENIVFNGYNIKLNYGNAINSAALLNGASRYIIDGSNATVKVNGTEVAIDDIEVQKDGLYIFTQDEIDASATVEVSFKNPGEVEFTGGWKGLSLDVDGATAEYSDDADLAAALPFSYAPAEIVKTSPVEGSFALPTAIEKFVFEFDHEIDGSNISAECSNGQTLNVASVEGKVVTLVGGDFPKGSYTITLKNVVNAGTGTPTEVDPTLSFETGEIALAQTIYTDISETLVTGDDGAIPAGWTCMVKGTEGDWTSGESWAGGSACRNMATNGIQTFYLCDRDGFTYLKYGDQEGSQLTLPEGDIQFSVIAVGHEAASRKVEFRVEDLEGNLISEGLGFTSIISGDCKAVKDAGAISIKFNNPKEQNVVVKIHEPEGGFTACRVLGVKVQTYKVTEGDSFDPEIVFNTDKAFADAKMPAEGTGWLFYENNNQLTPGTDRSGTSGMLVRNFHAKMQAAPFFRECGTNENAAYRVEYGNGNGVEGGLAIAPGKYEITYYSGTWNDGAGNAAGTSMVHMQLIDAETGTVVFESNHVNKANFENGGACNGQADKVVEKFSCAGGNYIIKAWGTQNTIWGGLQVEKLGSLAAKWYSKLADAVAEAETELGKCDSEELDGTAKTNLDSAIKKYKTPSAMYTEADFQAAIDEVDGARTNMESRRNNVEKYNNTMTNIESALAVVDEAPQYKQLKEYTNLSEVYTNYKDVTAKSLENEELVPVAENLENYYYQFYYMTSAHVVKDKNNSNVSCQSGVAVLTEQINALANKLEGMGATEYQSTIDKARQAISDDQELAHLLRLMYTKKLYDQMADPEGNPFVEVDPELMLETAVTIDATNYVQNPNVYCIAEKDDATTIANFPGWEADNETFGLRPNYGWGGWTGSANHLINNNVQLGIGWIGNDGLTVKTTINDLPVGVYEIGMSTMDRSGVGNTEEASNVIIAPEKQQSYIFYQQADEELVDGQNKKAFDVTNIGTYYAFTEDMISDVVLDGETTATVKLGAYIHAQESFAAIQKVKLTLKAKKEGFDYAAAAKAVQAQIDELLGGAGTFGDANGDGSVNIADVNTILGVINAGEYNKEADVNNDNAVNIADVNSVLGVINSSQVSE